MARKEEIQIVHPRVALRALTGFIDDVGVLMATARNAHSFLTDDGLDAEKVRHALSPTIKEAIDRVAKWYDTE